MAERQSAGLNKMSTLGLSDVESGASGKTKAPSHGRNWECLKYCSCFFSFEEFSKKIDCGTAGAAWGRVFVDADQNPTAQTPLVTALLRTQVTHTTSICRLLCHCVFLSLLLVPPAEQQEEIFFKTVV